MSEIKVTPRAPTRGRTAGNASGQPLPPSLQHRFETELGHDLSSVRVHEDHRPTMLGATAFTEGSNIFFAPGAYQPHDPAGTRLLGHELTHVVQQAGPRVNVPAGMVEVERPASE